VVFPEEAQVVVGKSRALSPEECAKIEQAVLEVEKRTAGEVVPVIAERSDAYPGVRWFAACAALMIGSALTTLLHLDLEPAWLVALLPVFAGLGYAFGTTPWGMRLLVSPERLTEQVRKRAVEVFFELDLASTRGRTGVLLYFSLAEHRVQVIADRGIHEKVGAAPWERTVAESISTLKSGRGLSAAVVRGVEVCGEVLIQHVPRSPEDTNEVPNRVVIL
jgi:putative membrane protein